MTTVSVSYRIALISTVITLSISSANASPQTIRQWADNFYRPYFGNHPPDIYSKNLAQFFTPCFSSVYFAAARCKLLADDPFIGGAQPTRLRRLEIVAVQSDDLNANVTLRLNSTDGDQWQMRFRLVNIKYNWLIDDVKLFTDTDWWSAAIQAGIAEGHRYHSC